MQFKEGPWGSLLQGVYLLNYSRDPHREMISNIRELRAHYPGATAGALPRSNRGRITQEQPRAHYPGATRGALPRSNGGRITQEQHCWHITFWSALYLFQPPQSRACTTEAEPTGSLLPPGARSLTLMFVTKDRASDSSENTHLIAWPMSLYLIARCGAGLL